MVRNKIFHINFEQILKKELDHWTDLYDAEMMERETQNMQLRHALEQQNQEHIELEKEVGGNKLF